MRPLLIDALRRSGLTRRSLGYVFLLVVANGIFPAAAIILLLRELFGQVHADTRQALVVLALTAASLLWLFVQVVLDRPMSFLLDLRPLLSMPIGFGALYRLRAGLSLTGWWCVAFGPAAVYVVLARSAGIGEAALLVFGMAAVVLIHGLIGSILQHWRHRLMSGWLGSIFMLGCMVAAFSVFLALVNVATGEPWLAALADSTPKGLDLESLRAAPWFVWVSWMPAGLLAVVAEAPRVTGENLVRVGTLWSAAIVLGFLDRELLARLVRGVRRTPDRELSRTIPLAWLLRKLRRLSPESALSLIECESMLRERSLRWPLLVGIAPLIVFSGRPDLADAAILVTVLGTTVSLNAHRGETTLPTGRIWKESFSLPPTLLAAVRAMGRVPSLVLAALLGGAVFLVALRNGPSQNWVLLAYAAGIAASAVVVSDGFYGWYDVRWQSVGQGAAHAGHKMLAHGTFVVSVGLFVSGGFFASLFGIAEVAPGVAVGASLSTVALSLGVWSVFRIRQARLVKERGLRLLVRTESS
ncbi:MAG: hypothetical protein F4Y16_15355 [Holophagales bacterium]|nr:hypothetical protein [Holophagales bacterium]MYH24219.1 hypothetical protein [Holophagales bacterium]